MTSLLAFFCLSFTAMRCRPFLLRCVDKFLWYFASFLSKEVIICSGVPFLTSPKCIFILHIYILHVNDIYHDSTWKHLRQPCANLAPSLCFAGFPCVTPHNELVKSYKSVGCVPPRLKFLFRTFDRLSHTYMFVLVSVLFCA